MHLKWIVALILTVSVSAEWNLKDESEGPCNNKIEEYLATNVNPTEIAKTKEYYVPIGSQALYRHYAEVLLGRPLANETELSEMQLKIKMLGTFTINRAFPLWEHSPYFSQKCIPSSSNTVGSATTTTVQLVCKPICKGGSPSPNLNNPGIRRTIESVIFTDNETTYLIVRCSSDDVQDYKVLSTKKTIAEPIKARILYKIKELGFDLDNLYYMQYDGI